MIEAENRHQIAYYREFGGDYLVAQVRRNQPKLLQHEKPLGFLAGMA